MRYRRALSVQNMSARQIKARVTANARIAKGCYLLAFAAPRLCTAAQPGNFVMVKVSDGTDPLLRRPLSIHRVNAAAGTVELLYEVVGKSTEILSRKKINEEIGVIGPLGNGFSHEPRTKGGPEILVAGGMGAAPLLFLAQRLTRGAATVLIGARTKAQVLCAPEFKRLGCTVRIATDDGSAGFHGRVTDLLDDVLSRTAAEQPVLYGCGPEPMLRAMAGVCRAYGLSAQVSLESHMACGIGACLGCVVRTKRGFERVCKEGPVFRADDLTW
ncbi:MAG: dihydroorotate dehydrogenase electron transfer subunit [Candidatus Omnitrophica bacterium]|nr:dihydroorotate dehydrogenase electron transfer subunit [Candidatus Omnitrophota bacterium]